MTTNDDKPTLSTNVDGQNRTGDGTVMTHDPLCPFPMWEKPCPICEDYARVRADERERCGREAQEAVAIMPLNSFPDGGAQAALVWRDGWQTGWDAATNHATREGDTQ